MKKFAFSLLLAAAMLASLASCSSDSTTTNTTTTAGGDTTTAATTAAATTAATTTAAVSTEAPATNETPSTAETTDVDFTIDVDITIDDGNAGLVFEGSGSSNFLMWQLAIGEYNDGNLYLRPHKWENGSAACLYEKKLNEIEGLTDISTEMGSTYHMKLVLYKNGQIDTYVNDVLVDSTDEVANMLFEGDIGMIGFRCDAYAQGTIPEVGTYDNLVVADGTGKILLNETFDSAETMFCSDITSAELVNGALQVTGKTLYMTYIDE